MDVPFFLTRVESLCVLASSPCSESRFQRDKTFGGPQPRRWGMSLTMSGALFHPIGGFGSGIDTETPGCRASAIPVAAPLDDKYPTGYYLVGYPPPWRRSHP